jgi:hypothetical protein
MPAVAQKSLLVKLSVTAIPWILSLLIFFQYQRRLRSFELCSFSCVAHERASMASTKTLKQVVEVSSENKISVEQAPRRLSSTSEERLHHQDAVMWSKLLESNPQNSSGVFDLKKPAWLKMGSCPARDSSCWNHCVPSTGDTSRTNCAAASKYELFRPQPRSGHCHASVLHMILDDVSYEMSLLNLQPMLIAGTLLGAYRNGTIIRWTRDVDLLYNLTSFDQAREKLATALERLGYNLFLEGIWRVCINSNHPLVANIFEGNRCANAIAGYSGRDVAYADLYHFSHINANTLQVQETGEMRFDDIFPMKRIQLLSKDYYTISKPEAYFLASKYPDVMVEKDVGYR